MLLLATQNTPLSICQDRRMRGKAGALQAIVDVSGMVSFSKKAPERCAADFVKIVQRGLGRFPQQA